MSRERQTYRVELEVERESETHPGREPRAIDKPAFRLLVLGDFSGRANRRVPVDTGRALGGRRPHRIDRDTVDDVMQRLGPQLQLSLGDAEIILRFDSIDDFHPDRLYERLPAFRALRETRERAAAPVPVGEARSQGTRASSRAASPGGSVLDQILGDAPLPPGGASAIGRDQPVDRPADALTEFVRRAVAPHVVPPSAPTDAGRVDEIDSVINADLRAILHHADFQRTEGAWRGLEFLVRRLETDSTLQVYVMDVGRAELEADVAVDDVTTSGAYRLLVETDTPWSMIVALYEYGSDDRDIAMLDQLGRIGQRAGAPVVASAAPSLVGSRSFGDSPDPDDWERQLPNAFASWRKSEVARFVGLTAPRFLLRLPYGGPDGEPTDVPDFTELATPVAHDEYLWGSSAFLIALLYGESAAAGDMPLRPQLDVGGLPLHLVRDGGDVSAKPCAEATLTARAVDRMLDRGIMAIQSQKDGDAVRVARMQSAADPLAALPVVRR